VYVCIGFWLVEVLPSPNDHIHAVGALLDASTNWTFKGAYPEFTVDLNNGPGASVTLVAVINPVWETVLLPAELVAVRVTV
jgi:hypothetical protein